MTDAMTKEEVEFQTRRFDAMVRNQIIKSFKIHADDGTASVVLQPQLGNITFKKIVDEKVIEEIILNKG